MRGENDLDSCYLRPLVFYGSEAMGVAAKSNPVRVAIAAWPWGAYLGADGLEKGIRVKTSSFTHHHPNITMCNAKAVCNYAVSILANQEATHDGYEEAMLLDPQGFVCQGSGENVFLVRDGKLHTPDLSGGALNGITRGTIMTFAAELGIPVVERRITRDEFYIADEAFFTGTAAEVTPIRELDNRPDRLRPPRSDHAEAAVDVLRRRERPQPEVQVLADAGRGTCERRRTPRRRTGGGAYAMSEAGAAQGAKARPGGRRGDSEGPAAVLPEPRDAALVEPSASVPRRRRNGRGDVPLLRHALPAGRRIRAERH